MSSGRPRGKSSSRGRGNGSRGARQPFPGPSQLGNCSAPMNAQYQQGPAPVYGMQYQQGPAPVYGMQYQQGPSPVYGMQYQQGPASAYRAQYHQVPPVYGCNPHAAQPPFRPPLNSGKPSAKPARATEKSKPKGGDVNITLTQAQFQQLLAGKGDASIEKLKLNEEKSRTVWAYHLKGDVEIPEICVFSIAKTCKFNDFGCKRLHSKCPLQWQFGKGGHWYNFSEFHSKELECAFQKPENDETKLSAIDPTRLRADKNLVALQELLGTKGWSANFEKMAIEDGSNNMEIRRLSTHSSALSKSKMATVYEWYFKDEADMWIKYGNTNTAGKAACVSNMTSDDIEEKFVKEKLQTFDFSSDHHEYVMDFNKMTQTNKATQVSRSVRRRTKIRPIKGLNTEKIGKLENVPSHWLPMKLDVICQQFTLNPTDSYFQKLQASITKDFRSCKIVNIQLNQNPFIWNAYQNKKKYIMQKNKTSNVNEMELFHGTDPHNVGAICEQNLDWRLHGTNVGQLYGRGSYFSNSASFAAQYSRPSAGDKVLLVVRVIVGTVTRGNSSMARPPINKSTSVLYDTTVNNESSPKIFVKYDTQEYYPEYIVTYR